MERTRTKSMIMQHSKELDDTLRVFHQQVLLLGIDSAFSFLWLPDEEKDQHKFWAAWAENNSTDFNSKAINYPLDRNEPATAQCLLDWESNEPVYSYHVPPAGVENYFAVWSELIAGVEHLKPEYFSGGLYYVEAFMKYGCFGVMVKNTLKEDEKKILARFAIEFERTYTRFLDLQKAEAQTREAQIEAALERVRSRAMAMHSSDELKDVAMELRTQMGQLGQKELEVCAIHLYEEDKDYFESWGAMRPPGLEEKIFQGTARFPKSGIKIVDEMMERYSSDQHDYVLRNEKEKALEWFEVLKKYSPEAYASLSKVIKVITVEKLIAYWAFSDFSGGSLLMVTHSYPDENSRHLLRRCANVFDLAYRRVKDLKKAEQLGKQAQIDCEDSKNDKKKTKEPL